jgi:glycosyltransferase involved in cell wall biosynthesis
LIKSNPSIIFPVKNEGENVERTLKSLFSAITDSKVEIIIVNDQSSDNCCDFLSTQYLDKNIKLINSPGVGPANARNLGASYAQGDILFFCDAHLEFEDHWLDSMLHFLSYGNIDSITPAIGAIGNPNFIGYGQTLWAAQSSRTIKTHWNTRREQPFETAILPGGCFAIKKSVFDAVGGFEDGFPAWGLEDVELSIKLWLFGFNCFVIPNVKILHLFRKEQPYKVALDQYYYNLLRLAYLHFNDARINKVRKMIPTKIQKQIESEVIKKGVVEKRQYYMTKRKNDDDWYFKKFNISF